MQYWLMKPELIIIDKTLPTPTTFTLSLQLKMLIKANYNQQIYGTSHGTVFYAIITNNEN